MAADSSQQWNEQPGSLDHFATGLERLESCTILPQVKVEQTADEEKF